MDFISPAQCRAARGLLNWSQPDLAARCGIHVQTVSNFEQDKGSPAKNTLRIIQQALELGGVKFTADYGICPTHNVVHIIEGKDAYLQLLDDVLWNVGSNQQLFKLNADERKSPPAVIEKNNALRAAGITMKTLVEAGNTYLMGHLHEYRHMPPSLFQDGDIKLIYGDRIAYSMVWTETPKVIIIHDKIIATEQLRIFNYIWDNSQPAIASTSPIKFSDVT